MTTQSFTESSEASREDDLTLEHFGYRQELKRSLGYFSAFALSFSLISVTTWLFANYGSGLQIGGPAFIWTWPIAGAGQFLVALVFGQLARQIPLSGYAYQWTRELSGKRLAWWAGWIMIVQFIAGMSGVCYAMANYIAPYLNLPNTGRNVVAISIVILLVIALINHYGIRLASLVNDFFDLPQNVHNLLRRVLPGLRHSMLLPYQFVSSPLVQNLPGTPTAR